MTVEQKKSRISFRLRKNNKPFVFSVCLLIATLLWFSKAMDKTYETVVSIPVRYVNVPLNNILVNPPPSKVDAKIRAHGFTLLRHKIRLSITPVILDLKPFISTEKGKNKQRQVDILTDRFIPQINEQINYEITVLDLMPDTLSFHFDFATEKKIKIIPVVEVNCQNQYFQSDTVTLTPAFVKVKGPVSIIDTLKSIPTIDLKFNNINSTVESTIALKKIDQLEYSAEKVDIKIPVSQFTEYKTKVGITLLNTPANMELITFPAKVDISGLVAFDKFNSITPNEFIVGVDYNEITPTSKTLNVKVITQPSIIRSVSVQPAQVEFIIKPK